MKNVCLALFAAAMVCASLAPAASAYEVPRNHQLIYAVEITQRFKMSSAWTGDLVITVNDAGIVSGQYRSNSIKPDPFRGSIVNVSGGLSGDFIKISFGTMGQMSVKGTISEEKISGTFYDTNNKTYDFVALRVTRE